MERAVILYTAADALRNLFFINKYISAFAERGFKAELIIVDGRDACDIVSAVSSLGACVAVNRTRSADIAAALEAEGVKVTNPSEVCRTANDKLLTYIRLKNSVPMLPAYAAEAGCEPPLTYPFVIKPRGGHGGEDVAMPGTREEYLEYVESKGPEGKIIQPAASELGVDLRVYVVGGSPIFAMRRVSKTDFRSNYCLGGSAEPVPAERLTDEENAIVAAVCRELPLHYAGVDIIRHEGRAVLNEIEDPVGARMLYTYTDLDPAALHVGFVLGTLEK